jgi:phosphatidate phosphatase
MCNVRMKPVHFTKIGADILMCLLTWELANYKLPIRKNGFKCDDDSLTLPYQDSTVSNAMLITLCTTIPTLIICGTELTRKYYPAHPNNYLYKIKMLNNSFISIPETLSNLYINWGTFTIGLLCVLFLTHVSKFAFAYQRPYYLDVCKPVLINTQLTSFDCKEKEYFEYQVDYVCLNNNTHRFNDAHLSFPSGHASATVYTMVFLIIYISYTWNCRKLGFIKNFVQIVLFSISFFSCFTRVTDHKHHLSDVIAGCLLGFLVCILSLPSLVGL